jgi:hypothetical protein
MSDWREQLRNNFSFSERMISDLHDLLRYNPDLTLPSISASLQQRGHSKATTKNTRKYLDKDPKIGKRQDTRKLHDRPTVYYLKEE